MKKFTHWLSAYWQPLLLGFVSIAMLAILGFYHLESITNGKLSRQEVVSISSASSGKAILNNPLFLPYKIGQYIMLQIGNGSVFLSRTVSVLFGFAAVILFYALACHWFSAKIAWISAVMLASSSLFLNYSRLAVPDILLPLALSGLLGCAWWINSTKHIRTALLGCACIVAASLYIPGIIWFIVLAVFIQRRHIRDLANRMPLVSTVGFILLGILLISPLIRAMVLQPDLILHWLALPNSFNSTDIVRELIYVPLSLTVRALPDPVFNLGRLPYIDILTLCLIVLGVYAFSLKTGLIRTRTLIGATMIAWILIAVSNSVSIILLLPLIYLMAASGIMLLLQQWYTVFPKNPIARTIGFILLSALVSLSVFYNLSRYFQAWGNSPVTKVVFQEKMPPNLLQ